MFFDKYGKKIIIRLIYLSIYQKMPEKLKTDSASNTPQLMNTKDSVVQINELFQTNNSNETTSQVLQLIEG